jgi:hypothetical protein
MSLQLAAQHLESKGRGRDKKLLHVSPRELQGLQALAKAKGGSLTLNPETGLPEAGFLEDILPILAAGAATYFTAGAATPMLMSAGLGSTSAGILAGAGSGALISGGMAAMQGGDVGKAALTGGIGGALGGAMGAYGGVTEAVTGTGINPNASVGIDPNAGLTQSTQVGTKALNLNPQTGSVIDPLAGIKAPTSATTVPASYGVNANTPVPATTYAARDTANSILNAPSPSFAPQPPPTAATPAATSAAPGKEGFFASMSPMGKAATAVGGAALLSELANPQGTGFEEEKYKSRLQRISPDFRGQVPTRPNPAYSAQYPVYAAGGGGIGDIMMAQGGAYDDEPMGDDSGMAGGGITSLGSYSDGGRMLKGPGDGMSDSIPATIGKKQPARLADGEFVVPADVVSHLGNGSTDAGAKKLYAMMDKVRQARTGKKRQAPAVKTDKYVPA